MPVIEEVCTITLKGQTTVPKAIRKALGVDYGGQIAFRVEDGAVSVHAVHEPERDVALAPFLALIERDLAARPSVIAALDVAIQARMAVASEGVRVDLYEVIVGEVSL